uniref:ATP synthase subunit delta n=1 Tax=Pasteuria ramosa TaxID=225322 RepID=Q1KT16_9BACL|nr:AtpH [Pasteuria ramosa]
MSLIAKRYAKALFDAAKKARVLDEVGEDLQKVIFAISKINKLWLILRNPSIPLLKKRQLLDNALCNVQPLVKNVLFLMLERKRELEITQMAKSFEQLVLNMLNIKEITVTTAVMFLHEDKKKTHKSLEQKFSSELKINWVVDDNLLGGIVVRIGDRFYDGSLRAQLVRFAQTTTNTA